MSLFSNPFARRKAELEEEIRAHLQMDVENRKARGESEEQARAAATREFGIYGLLAYLVAHRTKELGLRIALGAQRGDVMALVLRQAGWMLLAGSTLGLILAYMTSLLLRTFLYNVTAHDPWTMAAVTLLLVAGGLAASFIPARRAAMVDPIEALRTE